MVSFCFISLSGNPEEINIYKTFFDWGYTPETDGDDEDADYNDYDNEEDDEEEDDDDIYSLYSLPED